MGQLSESLGVARVVVIDGRAIVRELLAHYLVALGVRGRICTAEDGIQALQMFDANRFDFAILRLRLTGLDGFALLGELKARKCGCRSIVLGDRSTSTNHLARALRAGARGYLTEGDGLDELGTCLDVVSRGTLYVSSRALDGQEISDLILDSMMPPRSPLERLTQRERQVLELIRQGLTSARVAERLHLSLHTVEGHRASLMLKTQSHSIAALLGWLHSAEAAEEVAQYLDDDG